MKYIRSWMRKAFGVMALTVGLLDYAASAAAIPLEVAEPIQAHMVLQRGRDVCRVWGRATPGSEVTVTFVNGGRTITAKGTAVASGDTVGLWEANLGNLVASADPQTINVTCGGESLAIEDVVVGDVWLNLGQSNASMNMGWPTVNWGGEQETGANGEKIRATIIYCGKSSTLSDYFLPTGGSTTYCRAWGRSTDEETYKRIPAMGYHFARRVVRETGVPVGVLGVQSGGLACSAYAPGGQVWNASYYALRRYAVRGALWYQGENGTDHSSQKKLVDGLRSAWGYTAAEMPFYYVEVNFCGGAVIYPSADGVAEMSAKSKLDAMYATPNAALYHGGWRDYCDNLGMVSCRDFADPRSEWDAKFQPQGMGLSAHNRVKKLVGERLALYALRDVYQPTGEYWAGNAIVACGPRFESATAEANGRVRVTFKAGTTGLGLTAGGKTLRLGESPAFAGGNMGSTHPKDLLEIPYDNDEPVAKAEPIRGWALGEANGATTNWAWAVATVENQNELVLWARGIRNPNVVHYGFVPNPARFFNLYAKTTQRRDGANATVLLPAELTPPKAVSGVSSGTARTAYAPITLASCAIEAIPTQYVHANGAMPCPYPVVTAPDGSYVSHTAFTRAYSYANGKGTITLTGDGKDVTGTRTATFDLGTIDLTKCMAYNITAVAYTGEPVKPNFTFLGWKHMQTVLGITHEDCIVPTAGVDYIYELSDNVNPGTATVVMRGNGTATTGELTKTFKITANLAKTPAITVDPVADQSFTGAALTPSVTLRLKDGTALTEGTDYTVAYANNTSVGTATATVAGKGSYSGTRTASFNIVSGAVTSYLVTFKDWDGTTLQSGYVNKGAAATAPANPTRVGYQFTGWSPSDFTSVTDNLTIVAQYQEDATVVQTWHVVWQNWDGTVLKEEDVENGKDATAPCDPAKDGATFNGWSSNGKNITEDTVITAQFIGGGDGIENLRLGNDGRTTMHSADYDRVLAMTREERAYMYEVDASDMPKSMTGSPDLSSDAGGNNPVPLTLVWDGGKTADLTITCPADASYRYEKQGVASGVTLPNLVPGVEYTCAVGSQSVSVTVSTACPRQIVNTVWNMRDLGGWVGLNGKRVRYGKLFRSAEFNNVTEGKDYVAENPYVRTTCVEELGIRTDLDLRRDNTQGSRSEMIGMTQSPLGTDVNWVCRMGYNYSVAANVQPVAVALDPANYPLDFHCAGGKDRTGSVAATLLGLLGVSEDDLIRDYEATGGATCGSYHRKFTNMLESVKRDYPNLTLSEGIEETLVNVKNSPVTREMIANFRAYMLDENAPEPETHTHVWGAWTTNPAPDCVTAGSRTRICSAAGCDIDTQTETIKALGHAWGDWVVTKPAEIGVKGEETRTCARCTATQTREIAPLPRPEDRHPMTDVTQGYYMDVEVGGVTNRVEVFTNVTKTVAWTVPANVTSLDYLVVGGGGGGGYQYGGGGGGGGVQAGTASVTAGDTLTVAVGLGGAGGAKASTPGTNGGASALTNGAAEVACALGGGGGACLRSAGLAGANGGGGSKGAGGAATMAGGFAGGGSTGFDVGSGGGGAGGEGGLNNKKTDRSGLGGAGGAGVESAITGNAVRYAGGGGGGGAENGNGTTYYAAGGLGTDGGGNGGTRLVENGNYVTGVAATPGVDGLGGGGGGGAHGSNGAKMAGAKGGDGVVIIRYVLADGGETPEPPAGHTHAWGAWTTNPVPTCVTAGSRSRTCTAAGCTEPVATESEPVAALGHDFGDWYTNVVPQVGMAGELRRDCRRTDCNAFVTQVLPALPDPGPEPEPEPGDREATDYGYRMKVAVGSVTNVVCVFTNVTQTWRWQVPADVTTLDYLVVGGGGGGGFQYGGGGGGGGVLSGTASVTAGATLTVAVGAGGAGGAAASTPGTNGGASALTNGTAEVACALGGGGGACLNAGGLAGANGGGGSYAKAGGVATMTGGFAGGKGASGKVGGSGGGGAGGAGAGTAVQNSTSGKAGDGGAGVTSDITGVAVAYAGGGGGGGNGNVKYAWGYGGVGQAGGGNGSSHTAEAFVAATPGEDGTGAGGGGGAHEGTSYAGAKGGDGVVILRYAIPAAEAPTRPTVDGKEVEPTQVFETARVGKPITYPTAPMLSGEVGAQTISYGGTTTVVPVYYTASASGKTVALVLNDNAKPTVADKDATKGFVVTENGVSIHLENVHAKLWYALATASAVQGDWTTGAFTQGKADFEAARTAADVAAFYKVVVRDCE